MAIEAGQVFVIGNLSTETFLGDDPGKWKLSRWRAVDSIEEAHFFQHQHEAEEVLEKAHFLPKAPYGSYRVCRVEVQVIGVL